MAAPTYPNYPTADDVEAHGRSTGLWPEDDDSGSATVDQLRAKDQAQKAINWVIAEWERRVNWLPFLATDEMDEERDFDRIDDSGYINLEGGIVSIDSLVIAGETMVEGTDFRLEPRNAAKQGKPFEEIRMLSRRRWYLRDLGQIVVAARWGYSSTVPADAWGAMVETAARIVLKSTRNEQNISEISQDGFTKSFDIVGTLTQQDLVKLWETSFRGVYEGYKRVVISP